MEKTKWFLFGYMTLTALVVLGIAVSFAIVPGRDAQMLYTAYGSNIKTLDPGNIGDTTSSGVAGGIFECLYNYDYEARPYRLIPELAVDMPSISADGMTVTVRLRPGIHYFDPEARIPGWEKLLDGRGRVLGSQGPEIAAADFIFAWKRIADFHHASQNYSAIFEERIEGLDAWREYTKSVKAHDVDYDRRVAGLQALDPQTLQIRLTRPDPQLRYNLAHLPTAPLSRQAVEYWGDAIKHHPIGSGPYVLREHLPEQRIVFEANPTYRGQANVDGALKPAEELPRIKRLQMDYFEEDLPAWALFQQGLLDIAGIPKDVFAQAIDARTRNLTPEMEAKGIRLQKEPSPGVYYYGFNMADPVVGKNKPLRQAMSMAFDREEFIELFLNGRGQPAIGPIPPGFPTYDAKLVNPYTRFDVDGARKKLAEAERVHGGPIPPLQLLMAGTDTSARQMAEYMKKQMDRIGIRVNVEYRTWARFQEMIDQKQAQFYSLGWVADYPDEQTFLQLFWSKNGAPGPNSANYSNPEYDQLYERGMVMNPGPERDEVYRKMQRMVMEDVPWLLTFYPVSYTLYYDWVRHLVSNEYAHGMRKFLGLAVDERRRKIAGG
jgi:oligopeptide transport system substrate-binding protein